VRCNLPTRWLDGLWCMACRRASAMSDVRCAHYQAREGGGWAGRGGRAARWQQQYPTYGQRWCVAADMAGHCRTAYPTCWDIPSWLSCVTACPPTHTLHHSTVPTTSLPMTGGACQHHRYRASGMDDERWLYGSCHRAHCRREPPLPPPPPPPQAASMTGGDPPAPTLPADMGLTLRTTWFWPHTPVTCDR